MSFQGLLQVLVNGLLIGGVYGLAALGLSLIWGVMKVVNLAHGTFIMLGAYLSYWAFVLLNLHPLVSIGLALLVGLATGFVIYWVFLDRVIAGASHEFEMEMMTLLLTFAFSILIYGVALNAWGADLRGIPLKLRPWEVGELTVSPSRVIAFVTAAGLSGLLYVFLRRTYWGKAIRAVTQSRVAAQLSGIDPRKVFGLAFSLGTAYALIAGVIASITTAVTPYLGVLYILRSFTVVVLGGLGNPLGALIGGLILGVAESVSTMFASYNFSPAVSALLLIFILLVRPQGLFAELR